jgi:uncharacterized protein YbaP (TraB family)
VGKQSFVPLHPRIESAFAQADKLVLEVHIESRLAAAARMMGAAIYPAGDSLDRHLTARQMKAVEQRLGGAVPALLDVKRLRPWFVATLVVMTELQKLGYEPEHGIDTYFQERATGKKPIEGIETVDQQIALFSGLSERVQLLMLEEALEEQQVLEESMRDTIDAWKRGDARALEKVLLASMKKPEYQPVYQKLFVERNRVMAEAISGYLKTKSTHFVVVGAGHLVGREGVIELLRAEGHAVVQP